MLWFLLDMNGEYDALNEIGLCTWAGMQCSAGTDWAAEVTIVKGLYFSATFSLWILNLSLATKPARWSDWEVNYLPFIFGIYSVLPQSRCKITEAYSIVVFVKVSHTIGVSNSHFPPFHFPISQCKRKKLKRKSLNFLMCCTSLQKVYSLQLQ